MARKKAVPKYDDRGVRIIRNKARHQNALQMAMHYIQMGKTWAETVQALVETFDINEGSAEKDYTIANKMVQENFEKWREKIADRTYKKLSAMIEESYNVGDFSEARQGLDLLNKLAGNYVNKIEVKETPEFVVKFG